MTPSPVFVHLALLSVSLLFGANYVFTKEVVAAVPVRAWVLLRIAAATAILVPLALALARGRLRRGHVVPLGLAALLGIVLNQILFTEGIARTTPAHSSVINACIPTWTLCLAALVGQERFTLPKLIAVAIALAGVAVLLRVDDLVTGGVPLSSEMLVGDLLTWANGVSFAAHLVLMRRIGREIDPYLATAVMFGWATLLASVWCASAVDDAALAAVTTPPTAWFAIYAVLAATVFTYLLNTWALRHTRSSQVALYINVQPLVAAALGMAFGQGLPDWRFFVALAAVALGLWLRARGE